MSSTERAPEPTMEEILASIRRIISDEDSSAGEAQADFRADEGAQGEEEADRAIIDDIARVLSGESSAEDEDILDLTSALDAAAAVKAEAEAAIEGEGPILELSEQEAVAQTSAEAESPQEEPEADFTSVTVAIEATQTEMVVAAEEAPAPSASLFEQVFPGSGEQAASAHPAVEEPAPELATEFSAPPEETPSWAIGNMPWSQPAGESEAPKQLNGGSSHEAGLAMGGEAGPFDDSVKEMLRPLVRQWLDKNMRHWLDENMSRLIVAALRDELEDSLGKHRD